MLLSNTFIALALACSIAAAPTDLGKRTETQVVLGYRTVNKAEADKINAAGAPVWENVDYNGGRQLGAGIYTTPGPGQWTQFEGEWVCVIWCDNDALDRVSKAWVPSKWNDEELWWEVANITKYIKKSLDDTWDPAKTLHMAIIDQYEPNIQLLIPPALAVESGEMKLKAKCVEKQSDLPTTSQVNYDSWKKNIKGSRSPGSDPPKNPPKTG